MCLSCVPVKIRPRFLEREFGIKIGSGMCGIFCIIVGGVRYCFRWFYIKFFMNANKYKK